MPTVDFRCLTMLTVFTFITGEKLGAERRLFLNITSGYNSISRPVRNASDTLLLHFGLHLNQILDLNEKHQFLKTYVWINEEWIDENIGWEPSEFDGLNKIMLPSTQLWVPDVYIFNIAGAALDGFVNVTGSYLVLRHDGRVQWNVPLVIKSACMVDVTYFPYDKQACEIVFGSWIYDGSQVDLNIRSSTPDLSEYVLNNEFDLLQTSMERIIVGEACCPGEGDHPMVRFRLKMKRKSIYFDYIVIAPTIDLCVLTLATFLLPCECGWKIAIGLTVFLTLYVLQLLIAENVPDTNSTPLLGVFLLLVMTLNCVSLIMATIVINIKRRSQLDPIPPVPPLILSFCENYLSKVVCTHFDDWKRRLNAQYFFHSEKDDLLQGNNRDPIESSFTEEISLKEITPETEDTDKLIHNSSDDNIFTENQSIANLSYISEESSEEDDKLCPLPSKNCSVDKSLYRQTVNNTYKKRPSYRKAIRQNNVYGTRRKDLRKKTTKASSIFIGSHQKYQWYYVAEVIDKATFLVYVISMFISILTTLVIVPALT
ncbi:hypothetical protein CHS0354_027912 [Potamilus streckersoni]|uniref:Uncharacterized protein n=1 Tax=Potamilus streckersoni TaxID=2493646 RepID=A0AAE0T4C5_9BIVA|nr:hypothetical protein CHS0354_027912 [Potamilus streckersoni]